MISLLKRYNRWGRNQLWKKPPVKNAQAVLDLAVFRRVYGDKGSVSDALDQFYTMVEQREAETVISLSRGLVS